MESVARPPHRRKHSRNPYDDVFMSGGAEREVLEAHEYAEIFSGSSTIPVLDLSGLEERVGSGDSRSPKLDYSNIFGGFRNEAVPFPFEELFNGSADQPQLRVPSQGSDTLHSGGTSKITSVEASDQSADELKNQFNVSFNRTHQRNTDTSSGKAHVSHLQDVPAFTQFVDVTRLPKTDSGRTVNSLKRDVSRTWSFSAKPDTVRGKGETSREKSHVPDIKPQPRAAYFVPKKDVSEKNASEFSSPYYGEDFDENSVAAASAAALKTAIDQAQESIRLAKMIMHRKKEGYRNGSKSRQRGRPNVSDREGEMDRELKKNNPMEKSDVGIDGKYTPSLIHDDAFISAAKIEVESVGENAAEGKGHGTVLSGKGELFPPNGSQRELCFIDEKIESGKTEENVEAVETYCVGADIPVLLANEGLTANVEQRDVNVDHVQGPEVVAEFVERALDTSSQRIQELERNVEEAGVWNATFNHAEGPENKAERVLNTPQRTRRQWKDSAEAGEYFGIGLKDGIFEERENDMDDEGKKESAEVINVESATELRSDLDSIISETCNMGENDTLGQVETGRESERKENGYIWKTYDDEANLWFEGEEQLKEELDKKIDPAFFPEVEEGKKSIDEVHEPEIDYQKENHAHDGDEQILPGDIEKNEVEVRHTSASECEVSETVDASKINCDQVQNSTFFFNSEENCMNPHEEHISEPVDVNSSSSSTVFSETREACNVDLDNNSEDDQTVVENHKENYTIPEVIETFSETNKDKEVEHTFYQEDGNEMPRTEPLHQISPEENIFVSKPNDDFDSLSSDGSGMENVCDVGADPEELPEDTNAANTSQIHDVAEEFTSQKIDLSHVNSSDIRTSESDPEDVGQVAEEASESDEGSVSTSSHENINVFSAHDSEECEEKENDVTPINEELKDELDVVPNESKNAEEKIMGSEGAGERDPSTENNKGKLAGTSPTEEKEAKVGHPQSPDKSDYQQRIEAIKRGREREKDRKVVERAIREARERAFAEARERAERAAVEKATAEARQRAMAEAREKAAYMKLKAERAAVERATAEARERAMEKALSQKTTHVEKRTPEKVSGPSGSNGLKHSFSSSDLENATESAQRRKARLERHQRIMERAAKALAEKNMRDVLAQKEQAERNRLAESLDADIKRWATGKEKNLRALLSTLQYILGPDSGWKPIPLTDIITTVAVKKAYRKATLCVHPDKLQQRGATIKQKYICEKVFDLLKAAWNRFNSDER